MRIATLIIGLVLNIGLFLQSLAATAIGDGFNTEDDGAAGGLGIFMSVLWLVACALVIPWPLVSVVLFLIAGVIGIGVGSTTMFGDLVVWGVVSFILALFAFLGWRGKKKQQAKEAARDAQLQQSVAAQQQMAAQLAAMQSQPGYGHIEGYYTSPTQQ